MESPSKEFSALNSSHHPSGEKKTPERIQAPKNIFYSTRYSIGSKLGGLLGICLIFVLGESIAASSVQFPLSLPFYLVGLVSAVKLVDVSIERKSSCQL